MNIQLSEEAQAFVKSQLATGHFSDESEVVSRLLVFLQEQQEQWEAETHAKVKASVKAADEGRSTRIGSPAESDAYLRELLARVKKNRAEREAIDG